ncbi:MAG: hypothetical protein R3B84_18940 [Zavarzinella sp.]
MIEFFAGLLICFGIVLLLVLIVAILFLATLQSTLGSVQPANRALAPALVWLLLLPVINIFWLFVVVLKMAESLQNEYRDRGWNTQGESFGKTTGLSTAVLIMVSIIIHGLSSLLQMNNLEDFAPAAAFGLMGNLLILVILVGFIIYWVQIGGYGGKLRRSFDERHRPKRGYDFDEYERKRRRRERGGRRNDDQDHEDDDNEGGGPRTPRTSY